MAVTGTFRFHPVGQGLFYSGLINAAPAKRNGVFSFVYDCGSTSPRRFLYREIDDLKALLPRVRSENVKRLDMLIVSHLHDDHVNGLEYLLNGVKVDTVVMPYTDSITRLLARDESLGEEAFLDAFYANPVRWFVSRGVRRILLVGSPPEGDYLVIEPNELRSRQEEDVSIHSCIRKSEWADETELLYLDNYAPITINQFYWKFRFGNLELPKERSYINTVDKFQRDKSVSLNEIFRNKRLTRELIERLRPLFPEGKAINRTSVVAVHEPIAPDGEKTVFHLQNTSWLIGIPEKHIFVDDIFYYQSKISSRYKKTILTGDIELMNGDRFPLEKDMQQEFAVFQYPHHGAREAIPKRYLTENMIKVFSAGIANRYGHPDSGVLWENDNFLIVNERNAFDYSIFIV